MSIELGPDATILKFRISNGGNIKKGKRDSAPIDAPGEQSVQKTCTNPGLNLPKWSIGLRFVRLRNKGARCGEDFTYNGCAVSGV
jgi:hypothetical protein